MLGSRYLLKFLSLESSGIIIGGSCCALSWTALAATQAGSWGKGIAILFVVLSVLLLVGGTVQLAKSVRRKKKNPTPGKRVDIGGYCVHLLAEGETGTSPTIVWLPGSHSGGHLLHHFHKVLKKQFRSILFDRPGSGWSDVGPFPRRTRIEADELEAALRLAGEEGPFLLIGHSYGGLLAANYARRHPNTVAGVILLDATPVDYITCNPMAGTMATSLVWTGLIPAFLTMFGISFDFFKWASKKNPKIKQMLNCVNDGLEAALDAEDRPGVGFSAASMFRENAKTNLHKESFERIVFDGELQNIPLYVVIPPTDEPLLPPDASPMTKRIMAMLGITPEVAERATNYFNATRQGYLNKSSRSELIYSPEETTHLFPYEAPQFCIELVENVMQQLNQSSKAETNNNPE